MDILFIFPLAVAVAGFSCFFDFCTEEGNILHWYYKFIVKVCKVKTNARNEIISASWFFKPLGGCLQCFNFWAGVPFFIYVIGFNPFYFFLFQGISYLVLVIIKRIEK